MQKRKILGGLLFSVLSFAPSALSQDRNGDRFRYEGERVTRIEPGTNISVRTNEPIDVERFDNRVYYGTVAQDIRGDNGRLAIPRGARVELIVRVMRDNDLVLDLESVDVNGQRYAIQTDRNRVESQRDNSLIGELLARSTEDRHRDGQYEFRVIQC